MSTKPKPGYVAYLRWNAKTSKLIMRRMSRHTHPLTVAKWRRATGDKRPV